MHAREAISSRVYRRGFPVDLLQSVKEQLHLRVLFPEQIPIPEGREVLLHVYLR